jgi:hypothetical protein
MVMVRVDSSQKLLILSPNCQSVSPKSQSAIASRGPAPRVGGGVVF